MFQVKLFSCFIQAQDLTQLHLKSLNDLTPVYLKVCFQYSTDMDTVQDQQRGKVLVLQKSNKLEIRTFKARAIRILNALTAPVTRLKSLLVLKAAL